MEIKLNKFKMEMFKNKNSSVFRYNTILIIGDEPENKLKMIKEILKYHDDVKDGLIITDNDKSKYLDLVSEELIETNYNQEFTQKFMEKQKILKKRIQSGEKDLDNRRFLIMNDCFKDKSWQKDKIIREIFMNGRNWGVFYLMSIDKGISIPPNLRANIDFIFIFKSEKSNKKNLYEDFAGMIPQFEMFNQIYNNCTKENECLVIFNCSPSPKMEDQIFWYKIE